MRLPKVRFTVRRLMIATAIVALYLGVADAVRTHAKVLEYRRLAARSAKFAEYSRRILAAERARIARGEGSKSRFTPAELETERNAMMRFERHQRRYEYAAEHPREPLRRD